MHWALVIKRQIKFLLVVGVLLFLARLLLVDFLVHAPKTRSEPVIVVRKQHSKFAPLLAAFRENYLQDRELGSQVFASVNGETVLDAAGGWTADAVFTSQTMVFSSGKVIESLAVAVLADRFGVKYEDAIAKHWPEFGERFGQITVAQLMKHQARLGKVQVPFVSEQAILETFASGDKLAQWVLDSLRVDTEQDELTSSAYHAVTRGIVVDVLITKVTGRRGAQFVREEIFDKLAIAAEDCNVGVKPHSFAKLQAMAPLPVTALKTVLHPVLEYFLRGKMSEQDYSYWFLTRAEFLGNVQVFSNHKEWVKYFALVEGGDVSIAVMGNSPVIQQLPLLSASFICDAKSLGRINTELVHRKGGALLSAEGWLEALQTSGGPVFDHLMQRNITFTNAGWGTDRFEEDWVGWGGAGGSVNLFNVRHRAVLTYVPTMLEARWHKPNAMRILAKFKELLA